MVQLEHHPLFAAHLLFVVGVDHQGQHGPVDAGRGLHDMRDIALADEIVEVRQVAARGSLMRSQVVVTAGGDPLQLRPAKGEGIFDVVGAASIMSELILLMGAQAQVLFADPERLVELEALTCVNRGDARPSVGKTAVEDLEGQPGR
jgi:hypothetical protein